MTTKNTFTLEEIKHVAKGRDRTVETLLDNSYDLYIDDTNPEYAALVRDSVLISMSRSLLVESQRILNIASNDARSMVVIGQASLLTLCSDKLYEAAAQLELADSADPLVQTFTDTAKRVFDQRDAQITGEWLESLKEVTKGLVGARREVMFILAVCDVLEVASVKGNLTRLKEKVSQFKPGSDQVSVQFNECFRLFQEVETNLDDRSFDEVLEDFYRFMKQHAAAATRNN